MRRPSVGATLAIVGLVLLAIVLSLRMLDDWDLPWHLATGRIIAQTHAIPRVDDLAFTHGALKYTEVVSDLLLYATIRAFGPFGLQVLNGLFAAATVVVLHRACRDAGPFAWVALALATIVIGPWQYIRPATISLLFLAVVLLAIERHREDERDRTLLLLAPLQLVWANAHGYAPLGPMLLFVYVVDRVVAKKRAKGPLVAALLATVATSLSTAGPRLLVMVKRFDEDLTGITEWARPTPKLLFQQSPAVFLVLALLLVALVVSGDRARRVYDFGVVAIALGLFVTAIRFVPVTTVMVTPFVARQLGRFVRPSRVMELACGVAALLPAIVLALSFESLLGVGWYLPNFPEGATRFVEARSPRGRMWNFMPFGGWLAFRLYPRYRVFMDGRNALARDRGLVTRARLSMTDPKVFASLVAELDLQWAVVCTMPICTEASFGQPIADDPAWRMVYEDDVAAVYARQDGPNAALAKEGYRVLHHLTSPRVALELAKQRIQAEALAHDGALAASDDPDSLRATTFLAIGALATRDAATFRAAIARIEKLAPGSDIAPTLTDAWQGR